jgi:hypothetical protein
MMQVPKCYDVVRGFKSAESVQMRAAKGDLKQMVRKPICPV